MVGNEPFKELLATSSMSTKVQFLTSGPSSGKVETKILFHIHTYVCCEKQNIVKVLKPLNKKENKKFTSSGGSLGSWVDEERS